MTLPYTGRPRFAAALLALATPLVAAQPLRADAYALDSEQTEVRFSWNHLGLSRQSGQFRDVSGAIEFDPAEPEATFADITIKLASIMTGVAALDDALTKTREFFDVARFPVATFRSTDVKRTGGKTGLMIGDLTINGISRPVTLDVRWNFTGEHPMAGINPVYKDVYVSGFSATTQIRRSDWGITRTIPYVSDEIQITIETEMRRTGVGTANPRLAGDGGLAPTPAPEAVEREDLPPEPSLGQGAPDLAPPPVP